MTLPMNSEETATKTGLTKPSPNELPLIAPKHFSEFTPEEYHQHVMAMYEMRVKGSTKPKKPSYAEGLSLKLTKTGKISITRTAKKRAFTYVTEAELKSLSEGYKLSFTAIWNAFKEKGFLITKTRLEAEKIKADMDGVPW